MKFNFGFHRVNKKQPIAKFLAGGIIALGTFSLAPYVIPISGPKRMYFRKNNKLEDLIDNIEIGKVNFKKFEIMMNGFVSIEYSGICDKQLKCI